MSGSTRRLGAGIVQHMEGSQVL